MNLVKSNFTKSEIFESGAWYGASTIFIRLVAVTNTFIVVYFLTLYEYGVFKLILSFVGIFQAFNFLRLDGVIHNEIAQYLKNNKQARAAKLFFEFVFIEGVITVFIWIVTVITIKTYFTTIYDENFINILLIASITILLNFLSDSFSLFFRSIGAVKLTSKINSFGEVAKLAILTLIFLMFSPGIRSVIITIIISQLLLHVIYATFARKDLLAWWGVQSKEKSSLLPEVVKSYGKWTIGTNVLNGIVSNGRNYLIKFLLSTEAVAIWNVALSMMSFLFSLVPSSKILAVFLPYKVKLMELKASSYRLYVKYLTAVYSFLLVGGIIGATIMINAFFLKYKPSLPIFYIISSVLLISGINDFVVAYLNTFRHQKILFQRTVQKNTIALILTIVLVKLFGLIGLGIGYVVTAIYLTVFSYISLIKIYPELKLKVTDLYLKKNDIKYLSVKVPEIIRNYIKPNDELENHAKK